MLHCLNTSGNLATTSSEMTVLERQREATIIKWQQQENHHQPYFSATELNVNVNAIFSSSQNQGLVTCGGDSAPGEELSHHSVKPNPGGWPGFDNTGFVSSSGFVTSVSRTCSIDEEKMVSGKENSKKRKSQTSKVFANADEIMFYPVI